MARELVVTEENYSLALKPAPKKGAEGRAGEPIEEAVAANAGELPTVLDQNERLYPPARSNRGQT
jgi:hypothetical protein